jgi:hypothetical protein
MAVDEEEIGVTILDEAISPAAAVAKLQSAGIQISERTLRERARQLGACRVLGKAMFLLPSDIDTIINAAKPEPSVCQTSKSAETSGTTLSRWTEKDSEALRERLKSASRKTSRSSMKTGSVVPLSTARKPS